MAVTKKIKTKHAHFLIPTGCEVALRLGEGHSFQWQMKKADVADWMILNENENTIKIPAITSEENLTYICVVNDDYENIYEVKVDVVELFDKAEDYEKHFFAGEGSELHVPIKKQFEEKADITWQRYNPKDELWENVSKKNVLKIGGQGKVLKKYRWIVDFDGFVITSPSYNIYWDRIIKNQPIEKAILFQDEKVRFEIEVNSNIANKVNFRWQFKEEDNDWEYVGDTAIKSRYTLYSRVLEYSKTEIRCEVEYAGLIEYSTVAEVIYLSRSKSQLILEPIHKKVTVYQGEPLCIKMVTNNDGPESYSWEKVMDNKYVALPKMFNEKNLFIGIANKEHEGIYRCIGHKGRKKVISDNVYVEVLDKM